jgi:hypothetical protein
MKNILWEFFNRINERITAGKIFNELERSERTDDQEMEEKALEYFKLVVFFLIEFNCNYLDRNIALKVNSPVQMNRKIS